MARALVICADASSAVGLGHLMRCLAFAQVAVRNELRVYFLLEAEAYEVAVALKRRRSDWAGALVCVSGDETSQSALRKLVSRTQADTVIIDGYNHSEKVLSCAVSLSLRIIVMDDGLMQYSGWATVVVNSAGDSLRKKYQVVYPGAKLYLGHAYRLLRREFAEPSAMGSGQHSADRQGLVVNFGGSDPYGLMLPFLRALELEDYCGLVQVITGPSDLNVKAVRDFIKQSSLQVTHYHDCTHIAKRWRRAELAVVAAGSSQFELAACGTPCVLVIVAENQRAATCVAVDQGWGLAKDAVPIVTAKGDQAKHLAQWMQILAKEVVQLHNDSERLSRMADAALQHGSSDGAQNLFKQLYG